MGNGAGDTAKTQAGQYLPLFLGIVALNDPVPVNIWNARGMLLLPKGSVIESDAHMERLVRHDPMIRKGDYPAWLRKYPAPSAVSADGDSSHEESTESLRIWVQQPALCWPDLHERLSILLHLPVQAQAFCRRLERVAQEIELALELRPDDSLFMLVQMIYDRRLGYSTSHALMVAATCRLVGRELGLEPPELRALVRAALTMNVGMTRLHDELAQQKQPPDAFQRMDIRNHPLMSVAVLQQVGVRDGLWLQLVEDHHEAPDGKGYPAGKTELTLIQQLLHLSDLFAARISPRRSRPGMLPHAAVRDTYLECKDRPGHLAEVFVKTMGIYPPGSYVVLASKEIGVVARRGRRANAPQVLAIVNRQGLPMALPVRRNTEVPGLEVVGSFPVDEVKVRLDTNRLFAV